MGCAVNGPGEAANADFGIAGGINEGYIFKKGKLLPKFRKLNFWINLKKLLQNHTNNI